MKTQSKIRFREAWPACCPRPALISRTRCHDLNQLASWGKKSQLYCTASNRINISRLIERKLHGYAPRMGVSRKKAKLSLFLRQQAASLMSTRVPRVQSTGVSNLSSSVAVSMTCNQPSPSLSHLQQHRAAIILPGWWHALCSTMTTVKSRVLRHWSWKQIY